MLQLFKGVLTKDENGDCYFWLSNGNDICYRYHDGYGYRKWLGMGYHISTRDITELRYGEKASATVYVELGEPERDLNEFEYEVARRKDLMDRNKHKPYNRESLYP